MNQPYCKACGKPMEDFGDEDAYKWACVNCGSSDREPQKEDVHENESKS